MAAVKPSKAQILPSSSKGVAKVSILASLKSSIRSTNAKLSALRPQGTTKVTKTTRATKSKMATERQHIREVITSPLSIQASTSADDTSAASTSSHTIPTSDDNSAPPEAPTHPSLRARDFEVGGTLGRGKFGRVYLARHLSTNYICALKIISKAQCTDTEEEKLIRRELENHQNLAHRNILRLLSWFHDEKSIYLVLEYAPGGSLYSKMKKQPKGRFDERTTAQHIAQMAEALRYMHGKNIMHRDIKPENILLGFHSEIKLADFGYSIHTESGFRTTVCGTLDYLSPEVAVMMLKPGKSQEYYTKAIDQWSLGVLAYELLVGKPPFETKTSQATQKKIANFNSKTLKFPGHVSKGAEELIRELLNLNAAKRISVDDVLVHPWITRLVEKSAQTGLRSMDRMLQRAA